MHTLNLPFIKGTRDKSLPSLKHIAWWLHRKPSQHFLDRQHSPWWPQSPLTANRNIQDWIKKNILSKQYNMLCPLFGDFYRHTFPTNPTCVWVWIIASFISLWVFPNAFISWWALNSSKSTTSTNWNIIYRKQKNGVDNEIINFIFQPYYLYSN